VSPFICGVGAEGLLLKALGIILSNKSEALFFSGTFVF